MGSCAGQQPHGAEDDAQSDPDQRSCSSRCCKRRGRAAVIRGDTLEPDASFAATQSRFGTHSTNHGWESACEGQTYGDRKQVEKTLDRVACHATMRIIKIDPKLGRYELRMQCNWALRSHHMSGNTEISFRGVPGIRMPGMNVRVEESRLWKDLSRTESKDGASNTVFWRGFSIFIMEGFKKFQVKDFPFDRHVINLQQLDFVWRTSKDDDDYYNTMKVVYLRIVTSSVLAEWETFTPDIEPLMSIDKHLEGGGYSPRFQIRLRLQRHHEFYVRQIYFVSVMITISACSPLGTKPDGMGDRLGVYGGGLLSLVAFKYGIMEHLPSVPYSTFTDYFLLWQILTVVVCTFESLLVFRWAPAANGFSVSDSARWERAETVVDWIENITMFCVILGWLSAMVWVSFRKPSKRMLWKDVKRQQEVEDMAHTCIGDIFFAEGEKRMTATGRTSMAHRGDTFSSGCSHESTSTTKTPRGFRVGSGDSGSAAHARGPRSPSSATAAL